MDPASDSALSTASAAASQAIPFLYLDLGSLLVGSILVGVLFGVTSAQTYVYYNGSSSRDTPLFKSVLFFLLLLDGLSVAFCTHAVYYYTVQGFTDVLILVYVAWSASAYLMVAAISDFIVTGIFAYRVWKLSDSLWPLLIILPLSVLTFIGLLVVSILSLVFHTFQESQDRITWLWDLTYTLQAVTDVAIMLSLCILLIKRRTGLKRSNNLINALIFYSVNTCILTGSVSVANVLAHALCPNSLIWLVFTALLPKLMLNSLLALLNSRDAMRNKMEADPSISVHLSRSTSLCPSSSGTRQFGCSSFVADVGSVPATAVSDLR